MDTRAFGIAAGVVSAVMVFAATLLRLAHAGPGAAAPLARSVLFGYSISPEGAFIGAMWAYAYGFLLGAGFAFAYNLAAAPSWPPRGEGSPGPGGAASGSGGRTPGEER